MSDDADNLDENDDSSMDLGRPPQDEPKMRSDDGAAESSTDQNRMDLSPDYEPGSYSLKTSGSEDEAPGEAGHSWQQVHKVDQARPDYSAKSPKKNKRKNQHVMVLIGCNAVVFLASVCVMVLELTASRLIAKHVGGSLYTWTSVIGVVLAGITVGNFLGGWLADRFKPEKLVSRLFILSSISCLSVLWLDQLIGTAERPADVEWPTWVFMTVAQMFFMPAMALGTISPVMASIALSHTKRTGITVGNVYAWGAMGSIIGTFLTGFYLIDVFGTRAIIGGTAGALALLGVITATGQIAMRVFIVFGWMQFLTAATLAASMTADRVGEIGDVFATALINRDPTIAAVKKWHEGKTDALDSSICEQLASKSRDDLLRGVSADDRGRIERWAKSGRRDRLDQQAVEALESMFVEFDQGEEKRERWRLHAELLGEKLHELGILLRLRNDAIGEYHDESNYSYINVSDEIDSATGDLVKQLRLDKLAHSYVNLAEPTKLYYEYESIYAELTDRVAGSWHAQSSTEITAFSGLNKIVANLPKWASYNGETDTLTVTGVLTVERREELLKASTYGAYWLALEELALATQDTYWGGFSSVSLKSIPNGADNSSLLKQKMSFDANFDILNAFQELKDEDVERLAAIGDAKASAVWRTGVNKLFTQSRSVRTFFIGGGGFVFPRWIEHHYPHQSRIDVAELDPAVKLAVQEAMGLPDDEFTQVNTLIGDARNVIDDVLMRNKRLPKGGLPVKYDFIYGDAFNDLSVPWHLTTREFNQKVKALLDQKHGVYLINVIDIWPRAEFPIVTPKDDDDDLAEAGYIEVEGGYQIAAFEGNLPNEWKVKYETIEQWQPLSDPALRGAESLARDDGKFRIGFHGLMTNTMRGRLVGLKPNDKQYVAAINSMYNASQNPNAPGQFISACVNTLAQDFPNIYVFSTQHGLPSSERDTFVIAAAIAPIDFSDMKILGGHWDTGPFASLEQSEKEVRKRGQMDCLLESGRGLVLTDDFAPVDRLLRPVFADQE
jgi:hypothetical protein